MKRILRLFPAALLLMAILAGCANDRPANTTQTTLPTETTEATEPIDYTRYYGPWTYNVVDKAKEDGKLHYYFMSNEGIVMDADAEASKYKWGDCTLVVFPNGQTMLIDSGLVQYSPVLIGNLQQMGIKSLDYVIITHPHGDHQGGVFGNSVKPSEFLDIFEVKQVYYREATDPTKEAVTELVETVCAQRNIPIDFLEQGDTIDVGDVKIKVLWPAVGTSEQIISGTASVNNSSIVLRFDYGEHSSLFTGDLYAAGELLSLTAGNVENYDVDLLKVPHHGHKTSSSDVFLEAVTPELAIAIGSLNISNEVRDQYAKYEIPLVYNYINGYIHVSVGTDGKMHTETTRNDTPDAVVREGAIGD